MMLSLTGRLLGLCFAVAVFAACVVVCDGTTMAGRVLWTVQQQGVTETLAPTSPPLVLSPSAVFFCNQGQSSSFACAQDLTNPGATAPSCVTAPADATFLASPVFAGNSSLDRTTPTALAFSTQRMLSPKGDSSIVMMAASNPPNLASRVEQQVSYDAVLPSASPGVVYVRWSDTGNTTAGTTIARVAMQDQKLTFLSTLTLWTNRLDRVAPTGSTNLFLYENSLYFLVQDSAKAQLYQADPLLPATGATWKMVSNPCGIAPTVDTMVQMALVPYDVTQQGEVLSMLLVWGKLYNGSLAVCRVSHRSFVPSWNLTTFVFHDISSILSVTTGAGVVVVTGNINAPMSTLSAVYCIDGSTGALVWEMTRNIALDAESLPVVNQLTGFVYFSVYGLLSRRLAYAPDGGIEPLSGACALSPAVTRRRIYCVSDDRKHLTVLMPMGGPSNFVMNFTAPAPIAFPPMVHPADETIAVLTLTDGTILAVTNLADPSTPPTPSPDDSDDGGKVAAAILIPLCIAGTIAGAYWYLSHRKGRRFARAPVAEDESGGGFATNSGKESTGLYGTA